MTEDFDKAKSLIDSAQHILLTMHERMDGDDGGSILAFYHQLRATGKQVNCAIKKGVPPHLAFLPGSEQITDDAAGHAYDLLITFGCSDLKRTGSDNIINLKSQVPHLKIINIDHHPDNTHFGDVNVVDHAKSSVAELVYDLFVFHNWPITKNIATCLLTGIITDTGGFMHSNTQSSTLKAAAQLMRKGAQTSQIMRQTFKSKQPQVLKAWGRAMENSHYDDKNKIIFSVMSESDIKNIQGLPQAAFEGFTETLNTFPGARFALFLRQDGEVIKGSLRTTPYKNTDVAQIAKLFGGGGHKMAAGFSLAGKLTKDKTGKWRVV
ncbi:MAG: bifunctional oligoribonuclease/PAP phosphatase NrnA [Patescibacteria group bacterium]|nr:bifunctional oligoribonuclease/PAP phosphatase NrnA [Patescibacteria group bacterium]